MESTHTEVSGGGTATSIADLPSDWSRQMDEELRNTLKELDTAYEIDRDAGEFTANDALGIWMPDRQGTVRRLNALVEAGELTMRKAYDPDLKRSVNAYKMAK